MIAPDVPLAERTFRAVYEAALLTVPDQLVLRDATRSLTYGAAWEAALVMAGGLEASGVAPQEAVLLMLDNHVDNAECWLSLTLSGRPEVSVNTALKGDMLRNIIRDSGARTIVIEDHYAQVLLALGAEDALSHVIVRQGGALHPEGSASVIADMGALYRVSLFDGLRGGQAATPADPKPWDLMSISFTSGTTGRSKGVLCPHAHAFGHATSDGLGDTRRGETRFVVLPQFHIAGRWGGLYNAIAHQGCAYIAERFRASTYWDEIRAVGAATSQLVGTMATFLERRQPSDGDRTHGLREVALIPLTRDPAGWAERFGVKLTTAYGSTEAGSVVSTSVVTSPACGTVRDGYTVRVVDEHDIEVPDGQAGELIVRPELPWTSADGYLNAPEHSARAWRNGWFHTGDALIRNADGTYSFVDRVDEAIRRRGENISTSEVEHLILQHPAVAEVAIVGVSSEYMEDEIKAVVVFRPGHAPSELAFVTDLSGYMPYFMVPRFVRIADELPLTTTGKVRKALLREAGRSDAWDGEAAGFKAKR